MIGLDMQTWADKVFMIAKMNFEYGFCIGKGVDDREKTHFSKTFTFVSNTVICVILWWFLAITIKY